MQTSSLWPTDRMLPTLYNHCGSKNMFLFACERYHKELLSWDRSFFRSFNLEDYDSDEINVPHLYYVYATESLKFTNRKSLPILNAPTLYIFAVTKLLVGYVFLNSGYVWNKTGIKLKQNNFVSVLFQFYFRCNHCIMRKFWYTSVQWGLIPK